MATTVDGGCIFQWKIENAFHWWRLENEDGIRSPVFIAEKLKRTKWMLWFYPIDEKNENSVGIYLQRYEDWGGPDYIEVSYQLTLLGKDGPILDEENTQKLKFSKRDNFGIVFDERESIFVTERKALLPEDILIVQFTLWITDQRPDNFDKLFATTVVKMKQRYCEWKIDNVSNLQSFITNKYSDRLIACDMDLLRNLDKLGIHFYDLNDSVEFISCKISIIDSRDRKINCGIKNYMAKQLREEPIQMFALPSENWMQNRGRFLPNDILSLCFEFVLLTVKLLDCKKGSVKLQNTMSQNTTTLGKDLFELYNEGIFSDIELRTPTATFKAHMSILSARSRVFKKMFSTDMVENNRGYVNISDFESDTIDRMLKYMYTDSVEDLSLENASELYKAADKYELLSLKYRCASFITKNLCPTHSCYLLVLAYQHNDDDLKKDVQDYILRHRKLILCSEEWKHLMKTHLELAVDTMHKKFADKV